MRCTYCEELFDEMDEYDEHQCVPMLDAVALRQYDFTCRKQSEVEERTAAALAKERNRDNAYLAPPKSYWFDGVYDYVMRRYRSPRATAVELALGRVGRVA